jgi:hypothetical protein
MASGTQTTSEYIVHHLTNAHVGHGFWTFHIDTLIVSGLLGVVVFGAMAYAARRASSGVPGGWQNFVEMVVSLVDSQVRDTFHAKSNLVTPLAITIFVWVWVMNAMDLIPVDFLPQLVHLAGVNHFKFVPTTDPNLTFAMSLTVFFLMLWYNVKFKGIGGWLHEVFTVPFGQHVCGRDGVHPDRPARDLAVAAGPALGAVPHPDHHPAGFRVHDADRGLHEHGIRAPLTIFFPFHPYFFRPRRKNGSCSLSTAR